MAAVAAALLAGPTQKVTPEQRERLVAHDRAIERTEEGRVQMLTEKLVERLRPFIEAKNPGARTRRRSHGRHACVTRRKTSDRELWRGDSALDRGGQGERVFAEEMLLGFVNLHATSSVWGVIQCNLAQIGYWSNLKEKGAVAQDA